MHARFQAVLLLVLLSNTSSVYSASFTWDGGATGGNLNRWSHKQDWGNNGPPAGTDEAIFNTVAAGKSVTPTIDFSPLAIGTITYTNSAQTFNITNDSF